MDKPEFFVTPGYGEYLLDELHYSQAVKIGDRVETSGQVGLPNSELLNLLVFSKHAISENCRDRS